MNYWSSWYRSVVAGIALIAGLGLFTSTAFAQGTAPNTDISNQATLNYSVGGVPQPPSPSNTTTFKVDRLVRLLVQEVGSTPTSVVPGAASQVTKFSVTNQGNQAQAYILTAADTTGGTVTLNNPGPTVFTDNLVLPGCQAFVDANGNGNYDSATDTAQAVTTLAPGLTATVFVVCSIPVGATNGQVAVVALTATTAETAGCTATGAGCAATAQSPLNALDNPGVVETVFGDLVAGTEAGDVLRDGKHSARDAYLVASATIAVSKTVSVLCDPANFAGNGGTVFPRSIPGAYVRYEITVANTGAASATLTTISDTLNTNLNIDPDLATATAALCPAAPEGVAGSGFKLTCIGGTRACVATPRFFTTTSSADGVDFATPTITATFASALPVEGTYAAGELKPGESVVLRYNAIIK